MRRDPAVHQLIADLASERGLRLEYGTHYDALNWQLRWWTEDVLLVLDIQPVSYTHLDVYKRQRHRFG